MFPCFVRISLVSQYWTYYRRSTLLHIKWQRIEINKISTSNNSNNIYCVIWKLFLFDSDMIDGVWMWILLRTIWNVMRLKCRLVDVKRLTCGNQGDRISHIFYFQIPMSEIGIRFCNWKWEESTFYWLNSWKLSIFYIILNDDSPFSSMHLKTCGGKIGSTLK